MIIQKHLEIVGRLQRAGVDIIHFSDLQKPVDRAHSHGHVVDESADVHHPLEHQLAVVVTPDDGVLAGDVLVEVLGVGLQPRELVFVFRAQDFDDGGGLLEAVGRGEDFLGVGEDLNHEEAVGVHVGLPDVGFLAVGVLAGGDGVGGDGPFVVPPVVTYQQLK